MVKIFEIFKILSNYPKKSIQSDTFKYFRPLQLFAEFEQLFAEFEALFVVRMSEKRQNGLKGQFYI